MALWPFIPVPPPPPDTSKMLKIMEDMRKKIDEQTFGSIAGSKPGHDAMTYAAAHTNAVPPAQAGVSAHAFRNPIDDEWTPEAAIAMRLRVRPGEMIPFDHLTAHRMETRVIVLVVHGDNYQVIEDDGDLFPSDSLITKLKLLRG